MRPIFVLVISLVAALILPALASAQQSSPSRSPTTSYMIEGGGAALGATVASGAFLLSVDDGACGDDFGCIIHAVTALAAVSTLGSVAGMWAAAAVAETDGSLWGGLAGALVGAAAGLFAADRLGGDSDIGIAVSIGLTQAIFTAAGSRIGAALR